MFDPANGARREVWRGTERAKNRFNDAGVDRAGNLWITSMDFDAEEPTRHLWRVDPRVEGRSVLGGYPVLNGPVFSPDDRTIYFADTMNGRVLRARHHPDLGSLGTPEILIDLGPFEGLADGMAIDSEGCVWLARITAGCVSRYAPDGPPLATIALPVPMVTSVAFGGPGLGTLFVTTARIILSERDLDAYPRSGSAFALRPGVKGLDGGCFGKVAK
jgi:D-xylonolactonase